MERISQALAASWRDGLANALSFLVKDAQTRTGISL